MVAETEMTVEQKKVNCLRACSSMFSEWSKVCGEFNRLSAELEEECGKAKTQAQTRGCLITVFEMIGISFLRAIGCPFGSVGDHLGDGKRVSKEVEETLQTIQEMKASLQKGTSMINELRQMIQDAPAEKVEWWIYEELLAVTRKDGNFWENLFSSMRRIGVNAQGAERLMQGFDGGDDLTGARIRRVLEGDV